MAQNQVAKIKINMKAWVKALDSSKFSPILHKHMRQATTLNGLIASKMQRETIQKGDFEKNARLTQVLKKSDKPLVDKGDLFQSITHKVIDDYSVFSGVIKTSAGYNIAKVIHNGKSIKVTQRMRNLFYILFLASKTVASTLSTRSRATKPITLTGRAKELFDKNKDKQWFPLDPGTRFIRIPKRDWIKRTFKDPQLKAIAKENWMKAIEATIIEIANTARAESKEGDK